MRADYSATEAHTSYAIARIEPDPSRPSGRFLYLDGVECSYVDLADGAHLEFQYIRRLADLIDLTASEPLRVTHLGGGGFALPAYVAAVRSNSRQLVYEYDEGLIELARRELGLHTSPTLRVKVGDARERLMRRAADSADVVVGDAFVGKRVPRHLATVEFLQQVRHVLRPGGSYGLNLIDAPPFPFARAEAASLLAAFDDVCLMTDPDVLRGKTSGNFVFAASDQPLPLAELRRRVSRGVAPDRLIDREEVRAFAGSALALHDEPVSA